MLKRIFLAAVLALLPLAAFADFTGKDASGNTVTLGAFTLSGAGGVTVQMPKHALVDPTTGNALGVSGAPIFVSITNFPATQAISAASLPLPSGAATAAAQAIGNAALGSPTDAAWDGSASSASITAILKGLPRTAGVGGGGATGSVTAPGTSGTAAQAVQGVTNGVPLPISGSIGVSNFPATQAISAAALPLPAGAATSALQSTISANQNSTAAGTSATNAQAVQGVNGGVPITTATGANSALAIARTTVGTAVTLISAADPTNRRTVLNNGTIACEFGPAGFSYGAGFPLAAGQSFTFDNAGRTTAAIYGACSASGGAFAVLSF